mmetsp:Transcript_90810/g.271078  ORF Transcript_90810/g.271078 Transcript_90810/m.271078 type:complete len:345 (+) Transcript_90810:1128-2162(+)
MELHTSHRLCGSGPLRRHQQHEHHSRQQVVLYAGLQWGQHVVGHRGSLVPGGCLQGQRRHQCGQGAQDDRPVSVHRRQLPALAQSPARPCGKWAPLQEGPLSDVRRQCRRTHHRRRLRRGALGPACGGAPDSVLSGRAPSSSWPDQRQPHGEHGPGRIPDRAERAHRPAAAADGGGLCGLLGPRRGGHGVPRLRPPPRGCHGGGVAGQGAPRQQGRGARDPAARLPEDVRRRLAGRGGHQRARQDPGGAELGRAAALAPPADQEPAHGCRRPSDPLHLGVFGVLDEQCVLRHHIEGCRWRRCARHRLGQRGRGPATWSPGPAAAPGAEPGRHYVLARGWRRARR